MGKKVDDQEMCDTNGCCIKIEDGKVIDKEVAGENLYLISVSGSPIYTVDQYDNQFFEDEEKCHVIRRNQAPVMKRIRLLNNDLSKPHLVVIYCV